MYIVCTIDDLLPYAPLYYDVVCAATGDVASFFTNNYYTTVYLDNVTTIAIHINLMKKIVLLKRHRFTVWKE